MKIEDFIKKLQKESLKGRGCDWDVLYRDANDTVMKIDNKELHLYSLQAHNDTWLTINFMVKGERIMYCYDSYYNENKIRPARNGGIEYRCFPMSEEIINLIKI